MKLCERFPFLETSEHAGPGSAGQAQVLPNADALPSTSPRVESSLPGPTPFSQRVQLEGAEDLAPEAKGESAEGKEATEPSKYFSQEFDPASLPEPLQGPFQQMRSQFQELTKNIPSADVLNSLLVKADAFDNLAGSDQWKRFLAQQDANGSGEGATSSVTDDVVLEHLDDDQRRAVQALIDKTVAEKVQPVHQEFFADKARNEIAQARQDYGSELWDASQQETLHIMKRDGIGARKAFLQMMGEKLLQEKVMNRGKQVQAKIQASTLPSNAGGTTTPPPTRKKPGTIREAVEQAEEMHIRGDAWDPNTYRLQSGLTG